MQKEEKDYEVRLTPLITHAGEDDRTEVVDAGRVMTISGVNVDHYGDFFQIKGKDGSVVFSVPAHFVRYCQVIPRIKPLSLISDKKGVTDVTKTKGRKRSVKAHDDDGKEGQ